jgi:hypothetical protein
LAWEEDRGLETFQGGTQEILFVKDGIRVSEFEVQPGGIVPTYHHNGPYLLVAVTDIDLRTDVVAMGATPGLYKSGDSKWLPANYSRTITDTSTQLAKFVTLEFP